MTARRSIPTSSTDKAVWGYSCAISHPWHPAQPSLVAFVETITENPQLTFVVTSAIIRCLLISNSAACMMHGFMYSKEDAVTVSGYDLTNYPIKATAITGVISATPVSNAYLMNALVREDLGSENFPLISSECGDFVVVSKPTVLLQNNDSTL
ncbi:hypothetical protein PC110_g19923 [Phytophthora cactorum]|uniref:Uncharacterized protein n=1 Tax=Phytophthora cactorum TaxID=29920 RepID=A0A329RIY7_9STRA|nr:hypothetical protein PC110_g19923 [Phytophthora cactorum]